MTPADYRAAKTRLGLTHEKLAELLGIEPGTSRNWASRAEGPDRRAEIALRLIEHIGVDEARRIIAQGHTASQGSS